MSKGANIRCKQNHGNSEVKRHGSDSLPHSFLYYVSAQIKFWNVLINAPGITTEVSFGIYTNLVLEPEANSQVINTTKSQAVTKNNIIHTEISLISSAKVKYFSSHYNKYSLTEELKTLYFAFLVIVVVICYYNSLPSRAGLREQLLR